MLEDLAVGVFGNHADDMRRQLAFNLELLQVLVLLDQAEVGVLLLYVREASVRLHVERKRLCPTNFLNYWPFL